MLIGSSQSSGICQENFTRMKAVNLAEVVAEHLIGT